MDKWILEEDICRLEKAIHAAADKHERGHLKKLLDKKRHWIRVEEVREGLSVISNVAQARSVRTGRMVDQRLP
jgi:hypothetical protein